jgi:3-oxoacyl-[acyl-carrier-protein] synthase I
MLEHGFVAPSINIDEMDEQAAGLNIVTKPTEQALTTVMSNSFGFGGTNATLVMRKLPA